MKPNKAGLFWVRKMTGEGWDGVALVAGETPFLRVSAALSLSNGRRLAEFEIAEWGPEIIQPEND